MKKLMIFVVLAATLAPLTGCIIAPYGPRPYAGAHWDRGYYGAGGGWHRGHWG